MCVGIPMRVIESNGFFARCEGRGEARDVNVMLLEDIASGQWVLVHLGSAVRALDENEAKEIDEALDALQAALNGEPFAGFFVDLAPRR